MKWVKGVATALAILILVAVGGLVFIQTSYAKARLAAYIQRSFAQKSGLRIEMGRLDYDLLPLEVRIHNFHLYGGKDNRQHFLDADSIELSLPYSSLWSKDIYVSRVKIVHPVVTDHWPQPRVSQSKGSFRLDNVEIESGSFQYQTWVGANLQIQAAADSNGFRLDRLQGSINGAEVTASGALKNFDKPEYQFKYTISGDAAFVSRLSADLPKLSGPLQTKGELSGKESDYIVKGEMQSPSLTISSNSPFPLSGEYRIDSANKSPYDVNLRWRRMPLAVARTFVATLPQIASSTEGTVHYVGGRDFWKSTADFHLALSANRDPGLPVNGKIEGKLIHGTIQLQPATLTTGRSRVEYSGSLDESSLALKLKASIASLSDLRQLKLNLPQFEGALQFDGTLTGPYSNLKAAGIVTASSATLSAQANGQYFIASERMNAKVQGTVKGVDPDATGEIDFSGTAAGTVSNPVLQADLSGQNLRINGVDFGTVTGTMHSDGQILLLDAEVPAFSSVLHGSYHFNNRNFQVDGNFQDVPVSAFQQFLPQSLADLSGTMTGSLTASGNTRHPKDAQGTVTIDRAQFAQNDRTVEILPGSTVHLENRLFHLAVNANALDSKLAVTGTVSLEGNHLALRVQGQTDLKNIALFTNTVEGSGPAVFDLGIGGTFSNPIYTGTASASSFAMRMPSQSLEFTNGNATVALLPAGIQIQAKGNLNGAPAELSGVIPQGNTPGNIHFTAQDVNLTQFYPDIVGAATLTVDAAGTSTDWSRWNGKARVQTSEVYIQETKLETLEPVEAELKNGIVTLTRVHLKAAGLLDLTARGTIDLTTKRINGSVDTQSDLSLLSRFVSGFEASGPATVRITASGTLSEPVVSGIAEVHKGLFRMQGYPFLLENIELLAPITRDRIELQQLTASMGGGKITGGGNILFRPKQPAELALWFKAKNVGNNYPEGFRSQMDADLTLANSGKDYLLKGKVDILRSAFQKKIDPNMELLKTLTSQKKALVPEQTMAGRVKLQLDIQTDEDMLLQSNDSKLRAMAALQIVGTADRPRAFGQATVRRGSQLVYRRIIYYVEYANLNFPGKQLQEPTIHARLSANVDEPMETDSVRTTHPCEIIIELNGPLLDMTKTATPDDNCYTLNRDNAFSYLLFGETEPFSPAGRRHIVQSQLTAMLTGQLFSNVEEQLGKAVGLAFEPHFLISEGDPTAQFTLGKQFSDRFHLTYSLPLSKSTEKAWIAQYDVGRNFFVRFVEHDNGTYSGVINHRLRFGPGFRESKLNFQLSPDPRVSSVQITNQTDLPDSTIQKTLGLQVDDPYDFWAVRAKIDKLKAQMQTRNYLFPIVEVEETDTDKNHVSLVIRASSNGLRRMTFSGFVIPSKQISRYLQMWREGFSEAAVTQLIIDDVEQQLWRQGYFRATARETTLSQEQETVYQFEITPGKSYQKVSFQFHGANAISERDLLHHLLAFYDSENAMAIEAIHRFNEFKRKVAAVYTEHGYLEATVKHGSTSYDPNSTKILEDVTLEEGPVSKVADVEIVGGGPFPSELVKQLKLTKGSVYLPLSAGDDEVKISDYYTSKGFLKFEMSQDVDKKSGTPDVIVHYDLRPGQIAHLQELRILGNQRTNRGIIENQFGLKKGVVLTPDNLAKAENRLYALPLFQKILIDSEEVTPGQYDITIEVTEKRHLEARYGLSYDSKKNQEGEAQFTDSNVLGMASTATVFGKASKSEQIYRTLYYSPFLGGWNWNGLFVASRDRTTDPLLVTTTFSFESRTKISESVSILAGIADKRTHQTFFDPIDQVDLSIDSHLPRLRTGVLWDTRDDLLNAKHGNFVSTEIEYCAGFLGSSLTFVKTYNQFFHYQPVSKAVWASGVRVGMASTFGQEILLTSELFLAGGKDTIRGFELNSFIPRQPDVIGRKGGNAVFILNEEIRFPVYKWLGGVVFYDAGNVYGKVRDFSLADMRHSAGFGARISGPFGLMGRIDWGFNLSRRENETRSVVHFTFGQIF